MWLQRRASSASSTGFDPHVLLELWPLAGLVGCAGWLHRCASLVVGGGSASWRVGLAACRRGDCSRGYLLVSGLKSVRPQASVSALTCCIAFVVCALC
eukprot:SAG31_NODE_13622_length_856_cov_129.651255_1_plen_97_part_10